MSLTDERTPQLITKEITLSEAKKELEKNRAKRILFGIGGTFSLILAILGIFIPGIPTTPFALLSAALFAKSSKKLYNRLLNNKVLGPRIKNYQRRKGLSKREKIRVIVLMGIMVLISSFIVIQIQPVRIVVLSAGFVGAVVVWFFVPEGKDYTDEEP